MPTKYESYKFIGKTCSAISASGRVWYRLLCYRFFKMLFGLSAFFPLTLLALSLFTLSLLPLPLCSLRSLIVCGRIGLFGVRGGVMRGIRDGLGGPAVAGAWLAPYVSRRATLRASGLGAAAGRGSVCAANLPSPVALKSSRGVATPGSIPGSGLSARASVGGVS